METFLDYCKNYILDNIDDFEGRECYASDFFIEITEDDNRSGSLTYDRYTAMKYLEEWWWDCADFFDWEENNIGTHQNPFENPEAYMVCMVIEGVNAILSRCPILDKFWHDKIELTPQVIAQIKQYVTEYNNKILF